MVGKYINGEMLEVQLIGHLEIEKVFNWISFVNKCLYFDNLDFLHALHLIGIGNIKMWYFCFSQRFRFITFGL